MKTFEWGLLKICCAFLCMLTLLTACSNEELVENTSNCVGEVYVEIEGEKTSNGSQEHVTVDELKELPAIIAEAKQICNEKELAIDEFYTFAYGDKFVTVCGAVEQTDAQLLHEKYPDITFPDSIGDYKFQVASLDYKPTPSIQVSTSIPEGAELNSTFKQADETTYDHLLRMSISYYNEKKTLKIEVYRANAEAVSVQENNLNIEEEIGKYEIVSDSITSEMYLRWGNETWKYLMHENNGGTEENFCKALIDTGVSSLIAFR